MAAFMANLIRFLMDSTHVRRIEVYSFLVVCLVACLVGLSGCQKATTRSGVRISGRVTQAGQTLEVAGREIGLGMVQVGFCPVFDDGQPPVTTASAQADASGHFELVDPLPPGKYLITIRQWDPYPNVDKLKNKFDEQHSKIIRQLDADTELLIDVTQADGGLTSDGAAK